MQTIVELNTYLKHAEKLLSSDERNEVVSYLAFHPKAGAIIKGTGGIRKLRWRREGMGKSGGVRIFYYFYNDEIPLYVLAILGKKDRGNLSKAEQIELAKLAKNLLEYAKRRFCHG